MEQKSAVRFLWCETLLAHSRSRFGAVVYGESMLRSSLDQPRSASL